MQMLTYCHIIDSRRVTGTSGVGAAIREARLDRGLTQAQLAKRAQVSREWLSGVERGERMGAELARILRVFDSLELTLTVSPREQATPVDPTPMPLPSQKAPGSTPLLLSTNEATREALKKMLQPLEATSLSLIDEQIVERGRQIATRIAAVKKDQR